MARENEQSGLADSATTRVVAVHDLKSHRGPLRRAKPDR